MYNLRKTFVFGLLAAVCAFVPLGVSLTASQTTTTPVLNSGELAWHGGGGYWRGGWGGWGGRSGIYFYGAPYYYNNYYPYYYYNYYPYYGYYG